MVSNRKWPLNEAQRPSFRVVRVALGMGYNQGEGNLQKSRNDGERRRELMIAPPEAMLE
jgi:hypothetical protein